jgi:tetratricopeptide (TPR) repeat protein
LNKDGDETIDNTIKNARRLLAAVCALVIGVYAYMAQSGVLELASPNAADAYYNLLVQGFRAGQLSLKKEVPPGFAQLADPYDPAANAIYEPPPHRMLDLSYYKGKLYLYFGVTPALILFWPYVALTGHYLFHRQAVVIFCATGFLASVGLLFALWRRYFTEVSVGVVAACALALGLAAGVPVMLSTSDVYEVAISCGYMLTMLALAAIWRALHEPERRWRWLAAASVVYGLAVAARPSLLFGAVILLVPVVQAWRERRPRRLSELMSATGPILLIGLGLMLYNARRFDSPFEFGQHYQLTAIRADTEQFFSLHYLWFNFRVYFLEPTRWGARSPFVRGITVPPLPAGYELVRNPFGVLTNIPLVWLALAVPLAWRRQSAQAASILRWFVLAVALLFGICALTVGLFSSANFRYEMDFLPALLLLAVGGILGLERVLAPTAGSGQASTSESGQADRLGWRRAARWGWGLLLGFSVAFNLLASVGYYAEAHNSLGITLARLGGQQEAMEHWKRALQIKPDYAEVHNNMGVVLMKAGKLEEAMEHWEQAIRIDPDYADPHDNLGNALLARGWLDDAIRHYEQALRIKPDFAEAHNNLGVTLGRLGKLEDAIGHYEQAVRIKPDYAEAHCNLGIVLEQTGKTREAVGQYEQAVQIRPDYAKAHLELGNALVEVGKIKEAVGHYEQALRIKPDYVEAHYNLGVTLVGLGRLQEAMGHWEQAVRLNPDHAEAQYNLGVALEQTGKIKEAIGRYEQALRIKPDMAEARTALTRLQARQ